MSTNVARSIDGVLKYFSVAKGVEKSELENSIKPGLGALLQELLEVLPKDFDYVIFTNERYWINKNGILEYPQSGVYGGPTKLNPYVFINERIDSIDDAAILLNRIQEIERDLKIELMGKYMKEASTCYAIAKLS